MAARRGADEKKGGMEGGLGREAPYCGVGIEYVKGENFGGGGGGWNIVTGLEKGSVAEQVGAISVGDCLWMVGGKELKGLKNEEIRYMYWCVCVEGWGGVGGVSVSVPIYT